MYSREANPLQAQGMNHDWCRPSRVTLCPFASGGCRDGCMTNSDKTSNKTAKVVSRKLWERSCSLMKREGYMKTAPSSIFFIFYFWTLSSEDVLLVMTVVIWWALERILEGKCPLTENGSTENGNHWVLWPPFCWVNLYHLPLYFLLYEMISVLMIEAISHCFFFLFYYLQPKVSLLM